RRGFEALSDMLFGFSVFILGAIQQREVVMRQRMARVDGNGAQVTFLCRLFLVEAALCVAKIIRGFIPFWRKPRGFAKSRFGLDKILRLVAGIAKIEVEEGGGWVNGQRRADGGNCLIVAL